MLTEYSYILIFIIVSIGFVGTALVMARMFRPNRPGPVKNDVYECGETTIGSGFMRIGIKYYVFALLFLIFDVEIAFVMPWGVGLRELGVAGFVEMIIFLGILAIALMYAWKKGALEWQ